MKFEIGSRVKWKDDCPIRLGHQTSDVGQVLALHNCRARHREIDIESDYGDVVHRAAEHRFEPVSPELRARVRGWAK
jgi:hypothetical protein